MTDKSTANSLNQSIINQIKTTGSEFTIQPQLKFITDENGQEYIEINNDLAIAKIALQGGHIMTWQPKAQTHPVLWLSSNARQDTGRSIRGGVPICWPWFGAHATDATLCPKCAGWGALSVPRKNRGLSLTAASTSARRCVSRLSTGRQ